MGFLLPLGLVVALSRVFEFDLLAPLRFEGRSFSGGNLPYLFTLFGLELKDPTTAVLVNGLALAALVFVFLVAWSRGAHREPRNVIHLLAVVFLVFMLFSKKSFSNYLGIAAFPLFASLAMRPVGLGTIAFCGVFGVVTTLDPSLQFRFFTPGRELLYLSALWDPAGPRVEFSKGMAFLATEILLISCYGFLLVRSWRAMLGTSEPDG